MKISNNEYKILGLNFGEHACGVAYLENGEIKYCIEEERLTRVKAWKDFDNNFIRYPTQSLVALLSKTNIDLNDIDFFTAPWGYESVNSVIKACIGYEVPVQKFIKVEHHQSHCSLAYYLSGFLDDTFVISVDASGENHSAKYFLGSNGNMTYIDGIDTTRKSIGHFYAALTEVLGFKRAKDEGKVVGLSGHGSKDDNLYNLLKPVLKIENLKTESDSHRLGQVYLDFYNAFFTHFKSTYWKNDFTLKTIAYTGQLVFEEAILSILNQLHEKFPHVKKIAVAGGVFANVKLNKKINELPWVDGVFVAPPMGDEGLPLGSALMVTRVLDKKFKPVKITNMYFGMSYTEKEINQSALEILGNYNVVPYDSVTVANMLMERKILGLYQGASEYGPRALGNRSIICDATHPDTYDNLNNKLERNDFMPFAPSVLDEDADIIFNVTRSSHSAEFMTMLYDTREEWKSRIPTVVHPVDKTARIQIVKKEVNPIFYEILKSYKDKSGVGCLVNTSFNIHNEPIINHPREAFVHLKNDIIDALVTPYGIYKK